MSGHMQRYFEIRDRRIAEPVSIRAEVTTQADYVISILEQVELFVQIKLTEKMLCCSRMSLEHTTEKMA